MLGRAVGGNEDLKNFMLHTMQNSNGYPAGMSEEEAIEKMNQINVGGHVLIFPDDKDKPVKIDEKTEMSWHQYSEHNAGASSHFLVIGPQRPPELNGVRQIAMRNSAGAQLINQLPRSLQRMPEQH
ncbi:hypothetical protein D7S89_03325 [Trinickia fusca]|uniref:Uncharacterized protein n=2 Tax=Trinickia fusca TaxID=2419777 RepID=A0A494XPH5_9BURK|nr:hypothetical protein D7S89_03325 [Trinickia fusca]